MTDQYLFGVIARRPVAFAPVDRFGSQSLGYARIVSFARSVLVRERGRARQASPAAYFALVQPCRKAFRDRLAAGTGDD